MIFLAQLTEPESYKNKKTLCSLGALLEIKKDSETKIVNYFRTRQSAEKNSGAFKL
jgi:hypothetical protein